MEKLKSFLEDFKGFKDKRLRRRFSEAVQEIATARTCRVLTIARRARIATLMTLMKKLV